ncbi:MAG: methionine--tRNA ligase subunit beta, partial [Gemmatimonadetes bacterium]|nr:methionine--tRNA ligase subunit beta [Gemmatimonadota bacterium]
LINYIAAAGFGADEESFAKWWPADVHVIGKDITRFHCVIWPAMLMAAGVELPRSVFGHGFVYHSGRKMSKSLGNIVSPLDVVEVTGADPLRYYLLREITFGKDGDFTWDSFVARYNADLANDLGNLTQRTTDMTTKFLGGNIPEGADAGTDRTGLRTVASDTVVAAVKAYERFELSAALDAVGALVRRTNQVVQETEPWALAKDEARRAELGGVLSDLLEAVRIAAVLVDPAMPTKSAAILERLGVDAPALWSDSTVWRERPAWSVGSGDPIFPRLAVPKGEGAEDAVESGDGKGGAGKKGGASKGGASKGDAGKKGGAAKKKGAAPPAEIPFEAFQNVELLVATVKSAEPVEGADRLLKLQLDDGRGGRQVVAGIAEHFRPEDLPGKQVVVVANLKPAKIRGVESQGMVLAAMSGKNFTLLGPIAEIAPGAKIS